jgi:hypothetical protein
MNGRARQGKARTDRVMQKTRRGRTPGTGPAPAPGAAIAFLQQAAGNAAVSELLAGGRGAPLPPALRRHMEQRFGRDFGAVRIHDSPRAADVAEGISAKAFTVGPHIAFGPDRFAPGTAEGRRLVAHELAHVVQQSRDGLRQPTLDSNNALEREAEDAATQFVQGSGPLTVAGTSAPRLALEPKKKGNYGDVNRHADQGLRGKGTAGALESEHLDPIAVQRENMRNPATGKSPIPEGRGSVIDRAQPTVMLDKATADAKTRADKALIARLKAESKAGAVTDATARELGPQAGLARTIAAAKSTGTAVPAGARAAAVGQTDALHADPAVQSFSRDPANNPLVRASDAEVAAAVDVPLSNMGAGDLTSLAATKDPAAKTLFKGNYSEVPAAETLVGDLVRAPSVPSLVGAIPKLAEGLVVGYLTNRVATGISHGNKFERERATLDAANHVPSTKAGDAGDTILGFVPPGLDIVAATVGRLVTDRAYDAIQQDRERQVKEFYRLNPDADENAFDRMQKLQEDWANGTIDF